VLLALCVRKFDQIIRSQTRGFRQNRACDSDLIVSRKAADNRRRRLPDRRELRAHFGKRHAGTDVCNRSDFDCLNKALKHVIEERNLLVIEAAGGSDEQVSHTLDGVQALVRGTRIYCGFNFVDD
jgi:hypothetical protein